METTNTISFFWKAEFEDGYVLSQFKEDGTEIIIRDILSPELRARNLAKKTIIGKNVFSKVEQDHGRCVKFGWHPFDHTLANAIRALNEYQVAELNVPPQEQVIPADSYPNFFRESLVGYGLSTEPFKEDHKLGLGLIKRSDETLHVHTSQYDENDNLIEERNDRSFGNVHLEISKKPKEE